MAEGKRWCPFVEPSWIKPKDAPDEPYRLVGNDCWEERCAKWDAEAGRCGDLSVALAIKDLVSVVRAVANRM